MSSDEVRVDKNGTPLKPGDLLVFVRQNSILGGVCALRFYVASNRSLQIRYKTINIIDRHVSITSESDTAVLGSHYAAQIVPRDVAKKGVREIMLCLKLGGLEWSPTQEEMLLTHQEKIMEIYEEQYRTLSPHS